MMQTWVRGQLGGGLLIPPSQGNQNCLSSLQTFTSLNVNPLFSGGGELEVRTYEHQKGSIVEENIGSQVAADLQAINPGNYVKLLFLIQ